MARSGVEADNVTAEKSLKTNFATLGDLIEKIYHVHGQVGFVALSRVHILGEDVVQIFQFRQKKGRSKFTFGRPLRGLLSADMSD